MDTKAYKEVSQKDPEKEELEMKEADGEERVELKQNMTMLNGCNVIVGSIIGSGIFVSPSGVLMNTGSVNMSLVVWIVSGIFSMVGAICYAELVCMIKNSGQYVFGSVDSVRYIFHGGCHMLCRTRLYDQELRS